MNNSSTIGLIHCPNCGARIVPTSGELKQCREAAGLSQLQMAVCLKISRAQISHLENGKRSASASLIERYRKFHSELEGRNSAT